MCCLTVGHHSRSLSAYFNTNCKSCLRIEIIVLNLIRSVNTRHMHISKKVVWKFEGKYENLILSIVTSEIYLRRSCKNGEMSLTDSENSVSIKTVRICYKQLESKVFSASAIKWICFFINNLNHIGRFASSWSNT